MTRNPVYFWPGDDETRVFQYLDTSGNVVPLTGYTAVFNATVGAATISVNCTVVEADGEVVATINKTNTTALGAETDKVGDYEVVVTSSGGSITTIATGFLFMLTA